MLIKYRTAGWGDPRSWAWGPHTECSCTRKCCGKELTALSCLVRIGNFLWKCKVVLQRVERGWREAPGWAQRVWKVQCPSRGFLDGLRVWGGCSAPPGGLLAGIRGWERCSCTLESELLCDRTAPLLHPTQAGQPAGLSRPNSIRLWARYPLTCGAAAGSASQTSICKPKKKDNSAAVFFLSFF